MRQFAEIAGATLPRLFDFLNQVESQKQRIVERAAFVELVAKQLHRFEWKRRDWAQRVRRPAGF